MPKRVSVAEAEELVREGYVLVDVRSVVEFEAGHPKGAFNVPVALIEARGQVLNEAFTEVIERHFGRDDKLVLTCQAGRRSLDALRLLEARGFTNLIDLRPGWGGLKDAFGGVLEKGWEASGLPGETGDGGERSYAKLKGEER